MQDTITTIYCVCADVLLALDHYTQNTLSASRFCRRLARVPQSAWNMVFALLSAVFQEHNPEEVFAVDSYPVLVCANCRINRCQLFPVDEHETLCGYQASKKR